MDKYEKTITLEFESRQYTGCGYILSTTNYKCDVDKKLEKLIEMEEWLAESFPSVSFRYVGSNLVYSFPDNIVKFEIEPGEWIVKWKGLDIPDIFTPYRYEAMLEGFKKIG